MNGDALNLLEQWQNGTLDAVGTQQLLTLLQNPHSAAELTNEVRLKYALREIMQQQKADTHRHGTWLKDEITVKRRARRAWPIAMTLAASVAAALVLVVISWWLGSADIKWTVIGSSQASIQRHGAQQAINAGTRVYAGDIIITQAAGSAELRAPDGSRVVISEQTELAIAQTSKAQLTLTAGSVTCTVAAQSDNHHFQVRTPRATVTVHGTTFTVRDNQDATMVAVSEGVVAVRRLSDDASITLSAGGRTTVRVDGDLLDEATQAQGPRWKDHRPLALVRMWTATDQPGNPHHFAYVPPGTDLTTPAGQQRYATALAAVGTTMGQQLKAAGYQGVIVWDIAGQQANELLYDGNPQRLADLAPEMVAPAQAFFTALNKSGLRTGVLIRPERLVRDVQAASGWRFDATVNHADELITKAQWAQQQWGCSLFFVNTASLMPTLTGRRLQAGALAALGTAMPDSFIISDNLHNDDWGVAADWHILPVTGVTPMNTALQQRYPQWLRVWLWQQKSAPPPLDQQHHLLMREVNDVVTIP